MGRLDSWNQAPGFWDNILAYKHSNCRELFAGYIGMISFLQFLRKEKIQVLSYNITTVVFQKNMDRSSRELNAVERLIYSLAIENNITLSAKCRRGKQNKTPDQLSRMTSTYEFQLHLGPD